MATPTGSHDIQSAFNHAEEARKAGRFAEALKGYLAIISSRLSALDGMGAASHLTAADLVIMERATELAVLFGYEQGADNLLSGMSSALESARNFFGADYISVKRIHLALSFGRINDAYRLMRAMEPRVGKIDAISFTDDGLNLWESRCRWENITPADQAVIFSRLYLVIGWMLADLGQYNDALMALRRGITYTGKEAPDLARRALLPLNLILAVALMEQGELETAAAKLKELKSTIEERLHPGFYVRCLELYGKVKMLQGDFGGALEEYLKVLQTCRARGFEKAALSATLNLSHALVFLNNTSVARDLLCVAMNQAEALNETAIAARAAFLISLAQARGASLGDDVLIAPSVSAMRGRKSNLKPQGASSQPLTEIPQSDNFLTFFEDRALGFQWQLGTRNLSLAAQLCAQLRQVFGRSDSRLIAVRLQTLEGMMAYYQNEIKKAERLLRQSLLHLREMGLVPELWQAQRMLGWCWAKLGVSKSRRQRLTEENQQLLSQMTKSLPTAYQSIFLLNKWTDDEEFIASEVNRLIAIREKMVASSWFKNPLLRWSLMKRLHALLQYVDYFKHSLATQANNDPDGRKESTHLDSLWKLLWSHPRDRATISFLVLPDRVLITHLGWMKLDFGVSRITRLQIREMVRRWHVLINTTNELRGDNSGRLPVAGAIRDDDLDPVVAGTRDLLPLDATISTAALAEEAEKDAETLADCLQIPSLIGNLPARVQALTIIPHDCLLGFPFAAITFQGRYLIERFNLNVDFSLSRQQSSAMPANEQNALFVGVSQQADQFSPLPGVLHEIKELEEWATKRNLQYHTLVGQQASKSTIIKQLSESVMLHMACHGVFKANQPDHSGLVLIPTPNQVDILSLRDLSALNLKGLRHVSLSSCWSADNFILPGRWIIGLPETLCRAGARSVLASLWEVDDRIAISFMARFYHYLDNYPRDEALRRTQLDCLQKDHPGTRGKILNDREGIDTGAPFYWASFTLYGDYNSLEL